MWRNERRAAIRLLAASLVLLVSAPAFTATALAGRRTVHAVYPLRTTALWLAAGRYSLDQDPDATGFPTAADEVAITGPGGTVAAAPAPYDISPADLGGAFLGVGLFAQAAHFTIHVPGVYQVAVADPRAGARLYVSEPYAASAGRSGPWALGAVAAVIMIAVTGTRVAAARRGGARDGLVPAGTGGLDEAPRPVMDPKLTCQQARGRRSWTVLAARAGARRGRRRPHGPPAGGRPPRRLGCRPGRPGYCIAPG
ncbi:MAG TPA: hypothetical protein VH478_11765 [Trebonia sp.]|jgi:hypothetical protein|nr:hypothetical protein [Trebonia sp.]